VKVLDFGLAKALDASATSGSDAMHSPTLTARATQMGTVIGTAAYMAPEQARGKAVDRRADIWAFRVVLYEMLAGRRAFGGEDISVTVANVIKDDVNWQALPADLPASIRRLLRRCLEKDPRKRLSAVGDARLELDEHEPAAVAQASTAVIARPSLLSRLWPARLASSSLLQSPRRLFSFTSLTTSCRLTDSLKAFGILPARSDTPCRAVNQIA
jgi:eukaryotic-like serine/threonine-protein kinase